MKHAGIHFPENAGGEHPNVETILAMPGIGYGCTLICSPSARYWYRQCRGASPLTVWRAIPRQGKLPAQLGWDARKVAEECLNLWDEQPHGGIEFFQPLNELQFEKENGAPFPGYGPMAQNLSRLRPALRQEFAKRGQQVRLMWPPWVPMDDMDRIQDWHHEAVNWDVIGLHCYGSADTMRTRYDSYRAMFPNHPIFVGEWNANHEGHDERAILEMWADLANTDPGLLGVTYYIWETNNAGERDLSIWGNPARLYLFLHPPVAVEPTPEEPAPMPDFPLPTWTPAYQDIFDGSIVVADEEGLPRDLMLGLCYAESGDGLQSFDRWHRWTIEAMGYIAAQDRAGLQAILARCAAIPTNDISFGPCHQTWRWSPEFTGDPYDLESILQFRKKYIEDHGHALRVAAGQISPFWARYGPDKTETLSRYNKPDGTASASVRQRYANMLELARQQLGMSDPQPEPEPVPGETIYEQYPDPQPAGTLAACAGVIFHGSRSGRAGNPLMNEYKGTASYEVNNPLGLGWNATVGPGVVALHLPADQWGHNARAASDNYVGVEIAQPTVDDHLPDSVPLALADYIFDHVWPRWGEVWHFPSHAELEDWGETGANDGKTDLYPTGDSRMDTFRQKVYDRLNARKAGIPEPEPVPEPVPPDGEYVVGPGILAKMAEAGDRPATDEQYTSDQISEAWGTSGAHYVYLKATNRTYRYDPAA